MNTKPMRPWSPLGISVILVSALLLLPAVLIVPMSLSSGTTFQFPPPGFSLRWYENLIVDAGWQRAVVTSFQVSGLVTPLALIIGTLASFALHRMTRRARIVGLGILVSPLAIPNILIALAAYAFFLQLGLSGTIHGLVFAQTCLAIPFVVIAVWARLQGYDRSLTSAALSLGASPFTTFRLVTLPLILPGIIAGAVFAFVSSFDELVIALLLQGPGVVTLPVKMFDSVVEEADPTITAASTILVVAVSTAVLLVQLVWLRRGQHATKGANR
ncbi:MAG TPA: ABC transporter permease [Microbacterium sp.]|nr:ABC transporter permease [Microbacterium sp.]